MITGPANVPSDWNVGRRALSEQDVNRIRNRFQRGVSARILADNYGVSTRTVYRSLDPTYFPARCPSCGR